MHFKKTHWKMSNSGEIWVGDFRERVRLHRKMT